MHIIQCPLHSLIVSWSTVTNFRHSILTLVISAAPLRLLPDHFTIDVIDKLCGKIIRNEQPSIDTAVVIGACSWAASYSLRGAVKKLKRKMSLNENSVTQSTDFVQPVKSEPVTASWRGWDGSISRWAARKILIMNLDHPKHQRLQQKTVTVTHPALQCMRPNCNCWCWSFRIVYDRFLLLNSCSYIGLYLRSCHFTASTCHVGCRL